MADYNDLTDLHLAMLAVLWERGEATIGEVHAALQPNTAVSRKTVATLLSRLEQRGVVSRRAGSRENVYAAAVARRTVLIARMAGVLGALFNVSGGSPAPTAIGEGEVEEGDVERLRKLLQKAERDIRSDE